MSSLANAGWRRLVALPPLVVLVSVVTLAGLGLLIDLSGLESPWDSWGHLSVAGIVAMMYGVPTLLVTASLAIIGRVLDNPVPWAWAGAWVAALAGVALAGGGMAQAAQSPASAAFAGAAVVAAFLLVLPLVLCWRQRARDGRSAAG